MQQQTMHLQPKRGQALGRGSPSVGVLPTPSCTQRQRPCSLPPGKVCCVHTGSHRVLLPELWTRGIHTRRSLCRGQLNEHAGLSSTDVPDHTPVPYSGDDVPIEATLKSSDPLPASIPEAPTPPPSPSSPAPSSSSTPIVPAPFLPPSPPPLISSPPSPPVSSAPIATSPQRDMSSQSLSDMQIRSVHPHTSTLAPLSQSSSSSPKPFMLLLPDLDGVGMTSRRSWPALSEVFELQVLTLGTDFAISSPTSYSDLASFVTDHVRSYLASSPPERPAYLLGEGFGGVLALSVALECPTLIHRLLLVNPSTSYLSSPLRRVEPLLAAADRQAMGPLGPLELGLPLALAPALVAATDLRIAAAEILDKGSERNSSGSQGGRNPFGDVVAKGLDLLRRGPGEVAADAMKLATETLEQVRQISSHLPARSLVRRLALLTEGVQKVEPQLRAVEQRTMILVGGRDPVMASEEEGERLVKEMQRAFMKVLPDSGRCPLSEAGVDVLEILRQEGFLIQQRVFTSEIKSKRNTTASSTGSGFGAPVPLEVPNLQEVKRAGADWTATIRSYCSPVFLSTLEDGRVVEGLEGLPVDARPLLVVGNHQLYAFDMNVMVEEVVLQRGLLLRGLAHPSLFNSSTPSNNNNSNNNSTSHGSQHGQQEQQAAPQDSIPRSMSNTYRTFGAVEVSGKSFFRLLQQKEAVLLYPGGVREGFKRKQEKYQLFWPSKPEFVRMAARFSSTIVPLSAIGLEDSISLVLDSDELLANPLTGPKSRELAEATRIARAGVSEDPDNDHSFVPPIIAPNLPARLYFLFGRPIKLGPEVYDDREAAQKVYEQVKAEVEDGIGYLLRKREHDPYKDFLPRYLYENPPLQPKRKASSFPL